MKRLRPGYLTDALTYSAALERAIAWAGNSSRPIEPFKLPEFPPAVTKGLPKKAQMAMDDALNSSLTWAGGWAGGPFGAVQAAFQEGMEFLGYPYLSLLAQRPEYRVISETIAGEMTRKWIKFQATGDEESKVERIKQLTDEFTRLKVQDVFRRVAEQDGFFGRAHIYIDLGTNPDADREELKTAIGNGNDALSRSKVSQGSLKALRVVEPVWSYPLDYNSNDPLRPDWYRPKHWFVMSKEIHVTRFLTFVGREVPDLLKPAYSFGGLAMSQIAKPYIDNWLKIRQSVADIVQAFSIVGLKTNLSETLQLAGDLLFKRMQLFNMTRNNKGMFLIDKDSEDFWNIAIPLSGLDSLQAQAQEHMAAISRIPLVKLLGIQPTGLNASSEGEIRTFYDSILEYQTSFFKPHLTTVMHLAMLNIWGEVDPEINFEFEPLWSLDEKSQAEVREVEARTAQILIDTGVITPEEDRRRVAGDPDTPYDGLDVNDVPDLKQEEAEGLIPKGGGAGVKAELGEGGEGPEPSESENAPDLAAHTPEPGGGGMKDLEQDADLDADLEAEPLEAPVPPRSRYDKLGHLVTGRVIQPDPRRADRAQKLGQVVSGRTPSQPSPERAARADKLGRLITGKTTPDPARTERIGKLAKLLVPSEEE